jgi:glycosyltransferase involved in cell wall biosynthesis
MKNLLTVAYTHDIFSRQRYGGISRYYCELSNSLEAQKLANTKIFPGIHRNSFLSKQENVGICSLKLQGRLASACRFLGPTSDVLNEFEIKKFGPSIIHQTYYSGRTKRSRKTPTILTVYDMIHETAPNYFPDAKQTQNQKSISIKNATHIICVSNYVKNDLQNIFNLPPENVTVVPLGCHPADKFKPKKICMGKPYLLFVGPRGGYKNFSAALKAYSSSKRLMRELQLVLFGGGKLSRGEKEEVATLGIPEKDVTHVGEDDKILHHLYRNATAFIWPSLHEGFGIPPIEAMSCGCPVISSNASCMPEVLSDAAEFFDPKNTESIATKIEDVVFSEAVRTKLIDKGYKRSGDLSWDKCARETYAVYVASTAQEASN